MKIHSKPEHVIIKNDIHYFYWKWDFYKPDDYEPIKLCNCEEQTYIISRVHWKTCTIWNDLTEINKPSIGFSELVHTPIAKSNSYNVSQYLEKVNVKRSRIEFLTEKINLVELVIPLFKLTLVNHARLFTANPIDYDPLIKDLPLPDEYLFENDQITGFLVVGNSKSIITEEMLDCI